jgi:hypothetical protein
MIISGIAIIVRRQAPPKGGSSEPKIQSPVV